MISLESLCLFLFSKYVCSLKNAFPKCVWGVCVFCGCVVVSVWADGPIIHGVLRGLWRPGPTLSGLTAFGDLAGDFHVERWLRIRSQKSGMTRISSYGGTVVLVSLCHAPPTPWVPASTLRSVGCSLSLRSNVFAFSSWLMTFYFHLSNKKKIRNCFKNQTKNWD